MNEGWVIEDQWLYKRGNLYGHINGSKREFKLNVDGKWNEISEEEFKKLRKELDGESKERSIYEKSLYL